MNMYVHMISDATCSCMDTCSNRWVKFSIEYGATQDLLICGSSEDFIFSGYTVIVIRKERKAIYVIHKTF